MRTIPGLLKIAEHRELFAGKKIGLITNFSGILPDWSGDTAGEFLKNGFHICRLFTPEHGLYGAEAGEKVEDSVDPVGRIPVVSLYGTHRKPTASDLKDLDLLVYDIQDVGLRYYTYLYTMCYAMEAASEEGIPFVVLDRPNPLGSRVCGARMAPEYHCFVGDYELPMRYGLTIGEMARYFVKYRKLKIDLHVLELEHYRGDMTFPDTGLLWNIPSPALPTFESALCYSGGCLFESVNISEGRGSSRPFQMYGAPFLDMDLLYRDLRAEIPAGSDLTFRRRAFIPAVGEYQGQVCYGLEFAPLSDSCDFLPAALYLLRAIARRYPQQLKLQESEEFPGMKGITVLSGNSLAEEFLYDRISMRELQESWQSEAEAYEAYTKDIRLYPV